MDIVTHIHTTDTVTHIHITDTATHIHTTDTGMATITEAIMAVTGDASHDAAGGAGINRSAPLFREAGSRKLAGFSGAVARTSFLGPLLFAGVPSHSDVRVCPFAPHRAPWRSPSPANSV